MEIKNLKEYIKTQEEIESNKDFLLKYVNEFCKEYSSYLSPTCKIISETVVDEDFNNISLKIEEMLKSGCSGKVVIKHCCTWSPRGYYAIDFENANSDNLSVGFVWSSIPIESIGGCISDSVFVRLYKSREELLRLLNILNEKLLDNFKNVVFDYEDLYIGFLREIATDLNNCNCMGIPDAIKYDQFLLDTKGFPDKGDVIEYNGKYDAFREYVESLESAMHFVYKGKHDLEDIGAYNDSLSGANGPRSLINKLNDISNNMRNNENPIEMLFN